MERPVDTALPAALTIAGSDSGGGAGIQADLKTFTALGVHGTTALTCVTAQNPGAVTAVEAVAPELVAAQVRAVCAAFPIGAVKTGMLYSSAIIETVCDVLRELNLAPLVVDPVMVATSGARLLQDDAVDVLRRRLLPLAAVVTPNAPEAEILCGRPVAGIDDLKLAARDIAGRFGVACVAKGGHLVEAGGDLAVDILCQDGVIDVIEGERVPAAETHGTGCTFSAALAALLAHGMALREAVRGAKRFVSDALAGARPVGRRHPLYCR